MSPSTMMAASQAYDDSENVPLMGSTEYSSDIDLTAYKPSSRPRNSTSASQPWHARALSSLIAAAFFVSILGLFFNSVQFLIRWQPNYDASVLDVESLRRPSLYIGLERVPEIKAIEEAVKAAQAASGDQNGDNGDEGHVDEGDNDASAPDELLHPSTILRVNADLSQALFRPDSWVLVTPRDIIYMEFTPPPLATACALNINFPRRTDLRNKLLTIEGASPVLHVRLMPPTFQLNHATSVNRPSNAEGRNLGTAVAHFGYNTSLPLSSCTPGDSFILEMSCPSNGCRIEYEDRVGLPRLGLQLDTNAQEP